MFDMLEAFERAGCARVIHGYLGEPPRSRSRSARCARSSPTPAPAGTRTAPSSARCARSTSGCRSRAAATTPRASTSSRAARRDRPDRHRGRDLRLVGGPPDVAEEAAGDGGIVRPIFEPGDALLFDEMYLHSTAADPSMPNPRYAIESWFFGLSGFPAEYVPIAYCDRGVAASLAAPAQRRLERPATSPGRSRSSGSTAPIATRLTSGADRASPPRRRLLVAARERPRVRGPGERRCPPATGCRDRGRGADRSRAARGRVDEGVAAGPRARAPRRARCAWRRASTTPSLRGSGATAPTTACTRSSRPPEHPGFVERGFTAETGGMWTVDSPKLAFEVLDLFERAGRAHGADRLPRREAGDLRARRERCARSSGRGSVGTRTARFLGPRCGR